MPAKKSAKASSDSVLTQKDADRFEQTARKYGKAATASRAKARSKLQELGIHTSKGRLSKKYA